MGCHLPMKLREQNSRSQQKTRIQFSFVPQVAPRHRGNDCQIRWRVSVGSLFIITAASVSSTSDSKTLLLPWQPLLLIKNICEQTIGTENTIILGCMPRLVVSHGPRANPHTRRSARKCDIRYAGVSTGASTGGSSHSTSGSLM